MGNKTLYLRYRLKWLIRKCAKRLGINWKTPDHYVGKPIPSLEKASAYIAECIKSGQPFAACRFGSVELNAFWRQDAILPIGRRAKQKILRGMHNNAGFFPADMEEIRKFADLMRNSCTQMDAFAVWFNPMEDYVIHAYGNPQEIIQLRALEPWYVEKPWTATLAGKKVLVVHPFAETIRKQYEKRDKLFENPEVLPEFAQLHVIKAVQTIAGNVDDRFASWFDALDWMYSEAMKLDFDVAIIGCGAYGFPLAAKIKAAGKQAVHMGGATQLLFGIKGNRWINHPVISKLFNEHWAHPAEEERPQNISAVEGGCYW